MNAKSLVWHHLNLDSIIAEFYHFPNLAYGQTSYWPTFHFLPNENDNETRPTAKEAEDVMF